MHTLALFPLPKRQPTAAMLARRPLRQWMRKQRVHVVYSPEFCQETADPQFAFFAWFAGAENDFSDAEIHHGIPTDDTANDFLSVHLGAFGATRDEALQNLRDTRETNPYK